MCDNVKTTGVSSLRTMGAARIIFTKTRPLIVLVKQYRSVSFLSFFPRLIIASGMLMKQHLDSYKKTLRVKPGT